MPETKAFVLKKILAGYDESVKIDTAGEERLEFFYLAKNSSFSFDG